MAKCQSRKFSFRDIQCHFNDTLAPPEISIKHVLYPQRYEQMSNISCLYQLVPDMQGEGESKF